NLVLIHVVIIVESIEWTPELKPIDLARIGVFNSPKIVDIVTSPHANIALDEHNHCSPASVFFIIHIVLIIELGWLLCVPRAVWVWGGYKVAPIKVAVDFPVPLKSLTCMEDLVFLGSTLPPMHNSRISLRSFSLHPTLP